MQLINTKLKNWIQFLEWIEFQGFPNSLSLIQLSSIHTTLPPFYNHKNPSSPSSSSEKPTHLPSFSSSMKNEHSATTFSSTPQPMQLICLYLDPLKRLNSYKNPNLVPDSVQKLLLLAFGFFVSVVFDVCPIFLIC